MSKSPSLSDIITTTLRNHSAQLADNLTRDNTILKRFSDSMHWRDVWRKAVANMPWKTNPDRGASFKAFEQREALTKCLGVREGHIVRGITEGYEPKKAAHRTLLCQLAGCHSPQLAAIRLANLGQIDQYPHWPTP